MHTIIEIIERFHVPLILFPQYPLHYAKLYFNITTRILTLLQATNLTEIPSFLLVLICVCERVYLVLCNFITCVGSRYQPHQSVPSSPGSLMLLLYIHIHLPPLFSPSCLHIPNPFTVTNLFSSFLNYVILRMVPKWNHIAYNLLWVVLLYFFTQYNSPGFHPGCCVHQYIDAIYCWTASYVSDEPQFNCSLTEGHLGCF